MVGFDLDNQDGGAASGAAPAAEIIFDAGLENFEERVIKASMGVPVLVDFWAPWCQPCKQLMPVLESAVQATGGQVLMAKVNLDENQQLAQMLRVQSVPTVFMFFQGQPVDAFTGVQSPTKIQEFIAKAVESARQAQPGALDIDAVLNASAQALSEGNLQMAQAGYAQILQVDQKNVQAFVGIVRVYIAAGQLEQAEALMQQAPPEIVSDSKFAQAKSALEMAQTGGGDLDTLRAAVAKNEKDHQSRLDLAVALFAAGQREDGVEQALESVRLDPRWNEEAARKQVLKFFEAMGPADPLTMESRRKLSSLLFS